MFRFLIGLAVLLGGAVPLRAEGARPEVRLTPAVEGAFAGAASSVRLRLKVSLPPGFHTQSNAPRDPSLVPTALTMEAPSAVSIDQIAFPSPKSLRLPGLAEPLAVFDHEFVITARATLKSADIGGDVVVPAHLRYQACDDTVCYPPRTADTAWTITAAPGGRHPADHRDEAAQLDDFVVAGRIGYTDVSSFLKFLRDAETGARQASPFEGRGPTAILLIVLLGGFALNFTPCVLPLIPINLAIIGAGARATSRARGILLGGTYGGGMALAYGLLGLIVILTAGSFGSLNGSPWFNAGIAGLFTLLALAMLDVVSIDFSRFGSRLGYQDGHGSYVLAFSMGAVAALLAGACVAPVVIQVVLFASSLYSDGTRIALVLPFCLGLGMAAPWPIVGGGLAALPKPGAWMLRIKQALAAIIFATAAYYGYLAYSETQRRSTVTQSLASASQPAAPDGWTTSLADGLARAQREGKPVFIDLWATWCKNCFVMDRTTLADAEVRSELERFVTIRYDSEDPDAAPVSDVMKRLGVVGLPTYVVLRHP